MTDRKKRTTSLRDVRSRNVIEEAILLPRNLQNHRAHRQFSKRRRRAAALPLLLGAGQALDLRISRMKSELAVKPECAAVDRFVVAQSDLIRIDSENGRSEKLPIELQQPREAPCRFALAKRGKDVEADFPVVRLLLQQGRRSRTSCQRGIRDRQPSGSLFALCTEVF